MAEIIVPTGLILDKQGRALMTLRKSDVLRPNMWEYPGGKQNVGETAEEALRRELKEELGVEVEVGKFIIQRFLHVETSFNIQLFHCNIISGEPAALASQAMVWISPTYAITRLPCVPSVYLFYGEVLTAVSKWMREDYNENK